MPLSFFAPYMFLLLSKNLLGFFNRTGLSRTPHPLSNMGLWGFVHDYMIGCMGRNKADDWNRLCPNASFPRLKNGCVNPVDVSDLSTDIRAGTALHYASEDETQSHVPTIFEVSKLSFRLANANTRKAT